MGGQHRPPKLAFGGGEIKHECKPLALACPTKGDWKQQHWEVENSPKITEARVSESSGD